MHRITAFVRIGNVIVNIALKQLNQFIQRRNLLRRKECVSFFSITQPSAMKQLIVDMNRKQVILSDIHHIRFW